MRLAIFNLHSIDCFLFVQLLERLGLHIEVDEFLFNCINGSCILSSILQSCIYELVAIAAIENGTTIIQLRGYSDELFGITCNTKGSH